MKKSTTKKQKGGNSQSARLNQIVKRVGFIVITSIVLLLIFVGSNFLVSAMEAEQLENTMFLNQYRLGSKKLTSEVRAYAITSDQSHYDAYMKELNEDKNRDIAWDGLKKNRLSKDEWASLEHIADLSNGLVPLEEQSMEYAKAKETSNATTLVFGEAYETAIQEITAKTDETIDAIIERKSREMKLLKVIMTVSELLFLLSFIYFVLEILRTIKFSKEELLKPILQVSDQMEVLAQGNFHESTNMV